jgi:hypothetical protein
MSIDVYDKGDLVRVSAAFTNAAGTATDPTGVTLKVINPAGTQTTYTYGVGSDVVKSGTGGYYADITADTAGDWHYQWAGSGAVVAVQPGQFAVQPTAFS